MRESRWLREIRTLDPERDCRRIAGAVRLRGLLARHLPARRGPRLRNDHAAAAPGS